MNLHIPQRQNPYYVILRDRNFKNARVKSSIQPVIKNSASLHLRQLRTEALVVKDSLSKFENIRKLLSCSYVEQHVKENKIGNKLGLSCAKLRISWG